MSYIIHQCLLVLAYLVIRFQFPLASFSCSGIFCKVILMSRNIFNIFKDLPNSLYTKMGCSQTVHFDYPLVIILKYVTDHLHHIILFLLPDLMTETFKQENDK